jgi:lipopolysaccharide/colanic/teichoic acid biosynthesis glycosyltransferase
LGTISLVRQNASGSESRFERIGALVLFLLALPILVPAALILCVLSRRSPLIAHRRVGWQGRTLWMLKLRTMWTASTPDCPAWIERINDDRGPGLKRAGDPRVTSRFARFCRRHSIDELPQLWHVVTGEMSLVGPRPMTRQELDSHYGEDAGEILSVKPGLAGLWQVSGRNRLTYEERRRLDLQMVRERNSTLYFAILVRTLPELFSGENSW